MYVKEIHLDRYLQSKKPSNTCKGSKEVKKGNSIIMVPPSSVPPQTICYLHLLQIFIAGTPSRLKLAILFRLVKV